MPNSAVLALLLVAPCLVACQQGAEIRIEQKDGVTSFDVVRIRADKPACIHDLSVYEGNPDGKPPMWNIVASEGAPCVTHVEFPKVPAGFSQDDGTPALKLKPGQSYHVEASGGPGWIAFNAFTAR